MKTRTKSSHAVIFEVKFGQRSEESSTDSRERTADTLSCDLETQWDEFIHESVCQHTGSTQAA